MCPNHRAIQCVNYLNIDQCYTNNNIESNESTKYNKFTIILPKRSGVFFFYEHIFHYRVRGSADVIF